MQSFISHNFHQVFGWKPEGKRPLYGPRYRWEDSIRMYLGKTGKENVDWIHDSGWELVAGSSEQSWTFRFHKRQGVWLGEQLWASQGLGSMKLNTALIWEEGGARTKPNDSMLPTLKAQLKEFWATSIHFTSQFSQDSVSLNSSICSQFSYTTLLDSRVTE